MTNEKLYEILGDINENNVREARTPKQVKKPVGIKWRTMAACLCLIFVVTFAIRQHLNNNESVQEQLLAAIKTSGDIDTASVETMLPVERRIAIYEQLYVGSAQVVDSPKSPGSTEKLTSFIGEEYMRYEKQTWYRVKNMDEIKYLISMDETGVLRLWEYRSFYVLDSELNTMREEEFSEEQIKEVEKNYRSKYPDADLSPYTYGDVYRIIYHVESVDDIVNITASPSTSNNTDLGKKIQKEVGTHTYTERSTVTLFYNCTTDVVCYGVGSGRGFYSERDKYSYSFSTSTDDKLTSGEETWANRYLVVTLQSGTTIDSWKYSALNGIFYEFGGIFTEPLAEKDVYALNEIFGIK